MKLCARAVLGAGIAVIALWGCDRRVAGGEADGAAVYEAACARCHGERGVPPPAMVAQLGVRDLTDPGFQAGITDQGLRERVAEGSFQKGMPAFAEILTEAQIAAVAQFVRTLAGDSPAPGAGS